MRTLPPPKDRLGVQARINSEQQLGQALKELAWLQACENRVHAEAEAEIARIKERAEASLQVQCGRKTVSFAGRRQRLNDRISAYCEAHKDELLDGSENEKSRKFTHGMIAWRYQDKRIGLKEGETKKSVLEKLERATQVLQVLMRAMGQLVFGGVPLPRFVEIKLTTSDRKIQDAWKQGELQTKDLKQLGYEVQPAGDRLQVKVHDYTVETERRAA